VETGNHAQGQGPWAEEDALALVGSLAALGVGREYVGRAPRGSGCGKGLGSRLRWRRRNGNHEPLGRSFSTEGGGGQIVV